MACGRKDVLDIREIVRCLKLGRSIREIARDLVVHRKTIREYQKLAREAGWLDKPELPSLADIQAALQARLPEPVSGPVSSVEPHRAKVLRLHEQGVETRAILQILRDEDQFQGSYSGVYRFIRREAPPPPKAFVRIEVPAGDDYPAQEVIESWAGPTGAFHRSSPSRGQVMAG